MVHVTNQTRGVAGAQLAGAGFGGCMMVLVRRDSYSKLVTDLTDEYYDPAGILPGIHLCTPVAGSCVFMRDGGWDKRQ